MKIQVTNYFDVWGNKQDGWVINNQCHDDFTSHILDFWNKKSILKFLKRIGYLKKTIRVNSIIWDDTLMSGYELLDKDYCPLFFVEEVRK